MRWTAQTGTPWDVSYYPIRLGAGIDSWDKGLVTFGHNISVRESGSKEDVFAVHLPPLPVDYMEVPSLIIYPLCTEGWDGQLRQMPVHGDSMACPLLSIHLISILSL